MKDHTVIWLIDGTGERQSQVSQRGTTGSCKWFNPNKTGAWPISRLPHVHVNPAVNFVLTGSEEVGWQ